MHWKAITLLIPLFISPFSFFYSLQWQDSSISRASTSVTVTPGGGSSPGPICPVHSHYFSPSAFAQISLPIFKVKINVVYVHSFRLRSCTDALMKLQASIVTTVLASARARPLCFPGRPVTRGGPRTTLSGQREVRFSRTSTADHAAY